MRCARYVCDLVACCEFFSFLSFYNVFGGTKEDLMTLMSLCTDRGATRSVGMSVLSRHGETSQAT